MFAQIYNVLETSTFTTEKISENKMMQNLQESKNFLNLARKTTGVQVLIFFIV
jgi:hypothetical protein